MESKLLKAVASQPLDVIPTDAILNHVVNRFSYGRLIGQCKGHMYVPTTRRGYSRHASTPVGANSFVQQQATFQMQETFGLRTVYLVLCMQIATKQLDEQQQSIEQIDCTKRRKQHSVQVRIVGKQRWHKTSAEMPTKM